MIPHMVVAGMTRYGKSVFLKNIITSLIAQPVTFTLVDLKGGLAFNRFVSVSKVETVASDVSETLTALRGISDALKAKQKELLKMKKEDVKESSDRSRHFIIIDEGAEIASQGETNTERKKMKIECEQILGEIARIGGALGYRLIFATQYPTADTLPRQVKQNADARLCFRLPTETASRVVLDDSGAESLPLIKGRAIYRTDRVTIVQTPYIENPYIDEAIRPYITIKPRKEEHAKPRERRGDTLIIEET
jgi:S-DNA-T family DNA segregation ATPase FtsK/SpoIIIE